MKTKKSAKEKYLYAVGRRRTANARVRLYPKEKGIMLINGKPVNEYFQGILMEKIYQAPLKTCNVLDKYLITVRVVGSGLWGQLGAVVHGISRVLIKLDPKFRPILKKRGFLTRDPRKRQRRQVGMGGKSRRKKQSPRR